jgi:ABC-type branched-subunit amino acid transport system ATPase component
MPAPVLALEQISKRFGAIVVAERIDLQLAEGEALGIIGPNGAGKTTLFGLSAAPSLWIRGASFMPGATSPACRRRSAARWASAVRFRFRSRFPA